MSTAAHERDALTAADCEALQQLIRLGLERFREHHGGEFAGLTVPAVEHRVARLHVKLERLREKAPTAPRLPAQDTTRRERRR